MNRAPTAHEFGSAFGDEVRPHGGLGAEAPARHGGGPRLLVVCTANISRSAYAELRLRQMAGTAAPWSVTSAGVPGTVSQPMDPDMARLAVERGVDPAECQAFRSRRVTGRILARADLVVTMEAAQRRRLIDDHPAVMDRTVTLAQLTAAARARAAAGNGPGRAHGNLVTRLDVTRVPASSQGDVPDPYRRGPRAAVRAADLIDAALVTVLPHLVHL